MDRCKWLVGVLGLALLLGFVGQATGAVDHPTASLNGLRISGNRFVTGSGKTVLLHGVNRSGTEYACIQGWGIFDGPSSAASITAMSKWNINIVRVPLNEDCWLGINGVDPRYAGRSYVNAIVNYVKLLHQQGMYAELSLIWAAPGHLQANYQPNAPDQDHSPAMWRSLAQTFKGDPNVILAPWGETTVGWKCFMRGCRNEATYGENPGDGDGTCGTGCWYYTAAGMQEAVTDMRGAGYSGPIAIPCIDYANMCGTLPDGSNYDGSTWLLSRPSDPDKQLAAEAHVYGKNQCDTVACLNSSQAPILKAGFPVLWGETGETYDGSDCPSTSYIATFLKWTLAHGVGTEAWTWDTWGACSTLSLISNYSGTPEDAYGAYVEHAYQALS